MPLMNHEDLVIDALEARSRRRHDRRALFTAALGVAAVGSAFAYSDPARAQAAVTDADVLNFALNLDVTGTWRAPRVEGGLIVRDGNVTFAPLGDVRWRNLTIRTVPAP